MIGSPYYICVSTFHSTREALGYAYKPPTLEDFCNPLVREEHKQLHLGGVINVGGTSSKALVAL